MAEAIQASAIEGEDRARENPDADQRQKDAERGPSVFALPLATLRPSDPIRWLQLGWQDFQRCPRIGLFYGLCFFAMGHALLAVFQNAPAYVLALSAGFLLMGPFLCLGLYDASKAMQTHDHRPSLRASLQAWQPTKGTMGIFAGVLLILELLWGRASLVVFAVTFNTMPSTEKLLPQLINPENIGFLITYTIVGGLFAGLIFITSVISIPMIMDRKTDAVSAGLTSIRACLQNPGVMLIWGALITVLIGLAMLPVFLGLLIVGPVIGHATWHAYRHIVPEQTEGSA
ncbi:DUF2189 domain-containing protein [Hydrogenophaga aromaticivorans]|uniref:DUF2189 domain-containing protein n=1 Tax=Hydrogenophaga aromaticivorans TaxID=2610898 RepID=UPI001B3638A4|nr:DUF2189 domain-containing protein [Hydrogenophaga aromaticivorans]MBQ0917961.1 DUF2189 domain-containing protein [Hydrogenophaga aromaticivorans]